METEIIEPNPLLVEYYQIASGLFCDFDGTKKEFVDFDEWHYVPSDLNQIIFLLKRLDELNLLKNEVNVCDCGIGLATTMFDFYLQSKELTDRKFTFSGVEKHETYITYLKDKLLPLWEGNLNLIEGEIMEQNYSNYNIIYSYSPFRTTDKLVPYYKKLISEIEPGSLIIEFRNKGIGYDGTLVKLYLNESTIKPIQIDDFTIFQKV